MGQNALLIYLASALTFYILLAGKVWLPLFIWSYVHWTSHLATPQWAALLFSLAVTLLWWALAYQLCRMKIRLSV